jgi:hypothetical protein
VQAALARRARRFGAAARYWAVDVAWRFRSHVGGWVCAAAFDVL